MAVGLDEADGSWVAGRGGIYDLVMNSWCLVGIFLGINDNFHGDYPWLIKLISLESIYIYVKNLCLIYG